MSAEEKNALVCISFSDECKSVLERRDVMGLHASAALPCASWSFGGWLDGFELEVGG